MAEKLEPCPFCGGSEVEIRGAPGWHYASCRTCEVDGPVLDTAAAAACFWNTRKQKEPT